MAAKNVASYIARVMVCASLTLVLTIGIFATAHAALFNIEISPPGTDHAVGLAAANAVAQPASAATGNTVGAGILYNDVTNILSFEFAYGSDFGFGDLESDYSATHIHGPSGIMFPNPNVGAAPIFFLDAFHTEGSSARTGSFTGSVELTTAQQELDLLANLYYINIHSDDVPGGEIRGQLIASPVPVPGALILLLAPLGALVAGSRRSKNLRVG